MVRSHTFRRKPRRWPAVALSAALVAVLAVLLIVLLPTGNRPGRKGVESMFQDDQYLLFAPTATVARTLDTLKSLGVDSVRVQFLWSAVAPAVGSPVAPAGFDAANPAAYPAGGWVPYDRLVELALARGIAVNFDLTAPGPLWAMARSAPNAKAANHYRASAADFGQFVVAVGKRYSGSYTPAGQSRAVPRVHYWSVWNEPNQPGWLAPQWSTVGGQRVPDSPVLDRAYLDAAFSALQRTGHTPATDTILIGELAPEGVEGTAALDPLPPMPFLRALYCVDGNYVPLSGAAAALLQCPVSGSASAFVTAHPALFQATGFAHHPYSFFLPPATHLTDPNFVALADLSRLEQGLDRIFATYGVQRQLPIYLTEYGYETDPPNPFRGVSPRRQALFLNQAQYMVWHDPRVRSLSQFLLYDSLPDLRYRPGSVRYWSTFQTGLLYADGRHKPSFTAYRLPVFIPDPVFGKRQAVLVWGMVRLAANGSSERVEIQWRPLRGSYRTITTVSTDDPSGFFNVPVQLPGTGAARIAWTSPAGQVFHSRAVGVLATGR